MRFIEKHISGAKRLTQAAFVPFYFPFALLIFRATTSITIHFDECKPALEHGARQNVHVPENRQEALIAPTVRNGMENSIFLFRDENGLSLSLKPLPMKLKIKSRLSPEAQGNIGEALCGALRRKRDGYCSPRGR